MTAVPYPLKLARALRSLPPVDPDDDVAVKEAAAQLRMVLAGSVEVEEYALAEGLAAMIEDWIAAEVDAGRMVANADGSYQRAAGP